MRKRKEGESWKRMARSCCERWRTSLGWEGGSRETLKRERGKEVGLEKKGSWSKKKSFNSRHQEEKEGRRAEGHCSGERFFFSMRKFLKTFWLFEEMLTWSESGFLKEGRKGERNEGRIGWEKFLSAAAWRRRKRWEYDGSCP